MTTTVEDSTELDTAYALTLLSEYAYTLDSIPSELCKHFADLRELDAVLAASTTSITHNILQLTTLIEEGNTGDAKTAASRKAERLRLLHEITEESARMKPGAEDKIRVAYQAADSLKSALLHMSALLESAPNHEYDGAILTRETVFPHVDPDSSRGAYHLEHVTHERRRAAVTHALIESPTKKRRFGHRDFEEVPSYARSPRKDKVAEKARQAARSGKKNDRPPSPAESLLSVASALPIASRLAAQTLNRANSNTSNKRTRQDNTAYGSGSTNTTLQSESRVLGDWNAQYPSALGLRGVGQDAPEETENPDGEEEDHGLYCICQKQSYGEMVGCDDDNCDFQWFHLPCLGMTSAPEGTWYCDTCASKRKSRGGRNGKRKGNARGK